MSEICIERDAMKNVIWIVVVVVLFLAGCQLIKGVAGDVHWTFDKIDQAIVVPE